MRRTTVLILFLILFVVGGFILEKLRLFAPLKQNLHSKSVPTAVLNYGPMGKILKQLEVVQAIKNDYSMFPASEESEVGISSIIFQKKRHIGEYLYKANPGGAKDMPSSLVIDEEELKDGWPLISITVDKDNLYSKKKGIIANSRSRGREWERLAYVSYYEEGKLLFATSAGIRLHGGADRKFTETVSIRLYFRDAYGTQQFKPGILFKSKTEPIRTLVVRRFGLFRAALAFDISRRIGAVVPEFGLAKYFLNGKYIGIFSLTEHLSRRQWRLHFGHDNFLFYRYRASTDEESLKNYRGLRKWALDPRVKMTMKEASKFIDIDNLSRHLFSFIFLGTTDWRQGVGVLDRSNPGAKWFWINWDMDHSFIDPAARWRGKREQWKQEGIELILSGKRWWVRNPQPKPIEKRDVRANIFRRLLRECPEYRKYFTCLVMDLLNHRINAEFMQSRADYYEKKLRTLKVNTELLVLLKEKRNFMRFRPNFIRRQISRYLEAGESLPCEVKGPIKIKYEIDGYPEKEGYRGWYFKGKQIKVEIVSGHKASFSHWLVNRKRIEEYSLVHSVTSKTVIKPIFKRKSYERS